MVTLDKTPRPFVALVQDGKVIATNPAPNDEDREAHDIRALADCLNVVDVTAIDRFDAHAKVTGSQNA
ncbi:hypothetical protein M2271_007215 [Streptomyces sp. LBL]|uniref:hypothetical protein n=1 Tax=Streptomyces sp. LBL TaxID=2940562 RepID=UPI00247725E1|nr:hypothetical protein [Streptomyces sp. LBL]MDH6629379.1 hypothetical protein [Streptomyces sp. LBL]